MLLKNPTDYQGGFWFSYMHEGEYFKSASTEVESIKLIRKEQIGKKLRVTLHHKPSAFKKPKLEVQVDLLSYDEPVLMIRYRMRNITEEPIKEMLLYNLMDFDVGGPASYQDDSAAFNPESGIMRVWDPNGVFVSISSEPKPDAWEISAPAKNKLGDGRRDLLKNLEYGPKDIATALQWHIGTLDADQSRTVDMVLAASGSQEDTSALTSSAWEVFAAKMR
ncbi:MAG: hypothetical protein HXY34_11515 [Candidatus Thorarchaeota archaeon]|nr:hypothetical protein [Candidatus Thorarchaeota archaeon]